MSTRFLVISYFSYQCAMNVICMTVAKGVASCVVGIDSCGMSRVRDWCLRQRCFPVRAVPHVLLVRS